jgi:hypothetical protein
MGVASKSITFIPNFVELGHLVQAMQGDKYRQREDLIVSLKKEGR